jgi:hypothetical protein
VRESSGDLETPNIMSFITYCIDELIVVSDEMMAGQ